MIEVNSSENNRFNFPDLRGLSFCSRVNPIREAKIWMEQFANELIWANHIVVIGAGAGFHLVELSHQYPNKKIYVVEPFNELKNFFLENYDCNVSFIDEVKALDLSKERTIYLGFRPAFSLDLLMYQNLLRRLTAADSQKVNLNLVESFRRKTDGQYSQMSEKIFLLMGELTR